jgi:hypothetical protein
MLNDYLAEQLAKLLAEHYQHSDDPVFWTGRGGTLVVHRTDGRLRAWIRYSVSDSKYIGLVFNFNIRAPIGPASPDPSPSGTPSSPRHPGTGLSSVALNGPVALMRRQRPWILDYGQ